MTSKLKLKPLSCQHKQNKEERPFIKFCCLQKLHNTKSIYREFMGSLKINFKRKDQRKLLTLCPSYHADFLG